MTMETLRCVTCNTTKQNQQESHLEYNSIVQKKTYEYDISLLSYHNTNEIIEWMNEWMNDCKQGRHIACLRTGVSNRKNLKRYEFAEKDAFHIPLYTVYPFLSVSGHSSSSSINQLRPAWRDRVHREEKNAGENILSKPYDSLCAEAGTLSSTKDAAYRLGLWW